MSEDLFDNEDKYEEKDASLQKVFLHDFCKFLKQNEFLSLWDQPSICKVINYYFFYFRFI